MYFYRMKHRIVVFALLVVLAVVSVSMVSAQNTAEDLKTQRAQLREQLVGQANQLLGSYNIPPAELNNLLPYVAKNDTAGLTEKLSTLGLTQEQAGSLLQQAAPLIEQGMTSGIIQEFLAGEALKQVDEANIPQDKTDDVIRAMSNPQTDLETALTDAGLNPQDVMGFVQRAEELRQQGLGADDFDRYFRVDALITAMGESNLTQDNLASLIAAYDTNPQVFDDALTAAGIEPQAFVDSFMEAYNQAYVDNGFSEDEAGEFQQQAFLDDVAGAMDDPDELAALLAQNGYSDDDIQAFVDAGGDPEAIGALLEEQGLSADDFQSAVDNEQAMDDETGDDMNNDNTDNSDDTEASNDNTDDSDTSNDNTDSNDNSGSESGDTSNDNTSDSSGG